MRILGLWNPVPLNHGHSFTDQTLLTKLFVNLALSVPPETRCCGNNAAHGSISMFLHLQSPEPSQCQPQSWLAVTVWGKLLLCRTETSTPTFQSLSCASSYLVAQRQVLLTGLRSSSQSHRKANADPQGCGCGTWGCGLVVSTVCWVLCWELGLAVLC